MVSTSEFGGVQLKHMPGQTWTRRRLHSVKSRQITVEATSAHADR